MTKQQHKIISMAMIVIGMALILKSHDDLKIEATRALGLFELSGGLAIGSIGGLRYYWYKSQIENGADSPEAAEILSQAMQEQKEQERQEARKRAEKS